MKVNPETDNIYPNYYIPPYKENKTLRLVQGYLPKTNILYANHYELEIMRLLNMLGELFLSFGNGQAAVQKGIPFSYLLMVFTDINNEKTRDIIAHKKEWLLDLLRRGWIAGKLSNGKISEGDTYNLMMKYIIRNAIGTLPDYEENTRSLEIIYYKQEQYYELLRNINPAGAPKARLESGGAVQRNLRGVLSVKN